jgi:MoaA/NifB/PqqE/SkfB family radical SAM enzyme
MNTTKLLLEQVHLVTLHASINAASKEIYDQLVIGGDWENVCNNLEFFKIMRETRPDFLFGISMVVTKINYKEMLNFIDFGINRYSVDYVEFYKPVEGHIPNDLKLTIVDAHNIIEILNMPIFKEFDNKIIDWSLRNYVMSMTQ